MALAMDTRKATRRDGLRLISVTFSRSAALMLLPRRGANGERLRQSNVLFIAELSELEKAIMVASSKLNLIRVTLIGFIAATSMLGFGGTASAQGLFGALFNGPASVPQTVDPAPAFVTALPRVHHRVRHVAVKVDADPAPSSDGSLLTVGAGPLGPFLNDVTLQPGDAVVTPVGVMIFRGRVSAHHEEADFVPAGQDAKLPKNHQPEIAAIDRTAHFDSARLNEALKNQDGSDTVASLFSTTP